MDDPLGALVEFRSRLRGCLGAWGDALFELADALVCAEGRCSSVPALSLEPEFRRSHGSLYKSLAWGEIDAEGLRDLLVAHRPADWPAVFAVDASTWERADAKCSPGRGYHYSPTRRGQRPVTAGWSYGVVAQLSWSFDSWTAPVDVVRLPAGSAATAVTIDQVTAIVRRLGAAGPVPLFAFDAGYDSAALTYGLAQVRAQVLVRLRADRVLYDDPEPSTSVGRPRRHGRRRPLADPAAMGAPQSSVSFWDPRYGTVVVSAWPGLHPELSRRGAWAKAPELPVVRGTAMCVEVERLPRSCAEDKAALWLWWSGAGAPDLAHCARAYLRRFDLEHTFRFAKGTLGWTTPALCTPEQADRWTWLVLCAFTQLRLARPVVADHRLPWERPLSPGRLTPTRVRRGFRLIHDTLGTPASAPKSRSPGPGRPRGTLRGPRTRHPVAKMEGAGGC